MNRVLRIVLLPRLLASLSMALTEGFRPVTRYAELPAEAVQKSAPAEAAKPAGERTNR